MENDYSLYHFGVKGMRWGRRKGRSASDSSNETRSSSKKSSGVAKRKFKAAGKEMAKYLLGAIGETVVTTLIYNKHLKQGEKGRALIAGFLGYTTAASIATAGVGAAVGELITHK